VFAIVRKALKDLATTSLEERLGEVFTRRLREMDGKAKEGLAWALKTPSEPALVRSAFDLPAEQRAAIQNALNETFSADIHLRFETAPDLVSGIELTTNGQKVAWSIADYLASLEKGVDELLKEKDKRQAKAKIPLDLTPQIAKRAYELYEQQGRKSDSAVQDWGKAEREIRKDQTKAEPKPEAKAKSNPVTKVEAQPEAKAEVKPEVKVEPKPESKAETKPEPKTEPKPEAKAKSNPVAKVEAQPEAKAEVKPEVKVEPKPESKVEAKPEPKAEPKPEAKAEPKPETKVDTHPKAKAEVKPEVKIVLTTG
jgi:F-type H+-transporting ATPase subunit b